MVLDLCTNDTRVEDRCIPNVRHENAVSPLWSPAPNVVHVNIDADAVCVVSNALDLPLASAADLLTAVDELTPVWAAELVAAREYAQKQQARVLARRATLRDALSNAANLIRALGPSSRYATRPLAHLSGRRTSSSIASTVSTTERDNTAAPSSAQALASPIASLADSISTSASLALRNMTHTIHLVEFLTVAPSLISDAMTMLERISEAAPASAGIASDLYYAHENVCVCERVRDLSLLEALPNLANAGQITKIFAGTDEARDQLDHYLMANIFSAVPRYAHLDPRVLVAAIRVVQRESLEDAWWQRHLAQRNLSNAGALVRPFGKRDYERRMHEAIVASIERAFSKPSNPMSSISDTLSWLKHLVSQEQDVRRFVVPCFPPQYDVGTLFTNEYHRCVMAVITDLFRTTESVSDADSELVEIVRWYSEFRSGTSAYSAPGGLELPLDQKLRLVSAIDRHARAKLAARVDEVVDGDKLCIVKYDGNDSGKLPTHSASLEFASRTNMHGQAGEGIVTTNAPELVFSAIGQQLKEARVLGVPAVNTAVVHLVTCILSSFKIKVCGLFQKDGSNSFAKTNEDYVCAIANNMARCLEYTEDIRDIVAQDVEESARGKVEEEFEDAIDGFRSAAACAIEDLALMVEMEVMPLSCRLYAPRTGTEVMLDIIEVTREIFSRLEINLLPYHFERFALESLKRITRQYAKPFLELSMTAGDDGSSSHRNGSVKFNAPNPRFKDGYRSASGLPMLKAEAVLAQMDRDISCLGDFFETKIKSYEKKQFQPTMEALYSLRTLLTCLPTTQGLTAAHRRASAALAEILDGDPLPLSVSETLWTARSDVKPTTLLEASARIRAYREEDESDDSSKLLETSNELGADSSASLGLVWGGRHVMDFKSP